MPMLLDRVLAHRTDEEAMEALARSCRMRSSRVGSRSFAGAVPVIVDQIAETASRTEGATALLRAARSFSWAERSEPLQLLRQPNNRAGEEIAKLLFGESLPTVVDALAEGAGVDPASAEVAIEISSTFALAVVAGEPSEELTLERFVGLVRAATGPVSAAAPSRPAAPVGASLPASSALPEPSTGEHKRPMIVAAVAALLVVVGAFAFARGGDGNDAEDLAFTDDPTTTVADSADAGSATTGSAITEPDVTPVVPVTEDAGGDDASNDNVGGDVLVDTENPEIVALRVPMHDIESVTPEASGVLAFEFNTVTGEVCYSVESTDIQGPYRSHIHVGEIGVQGGIVVDLGPLESGDIGCVDNLPVDTNAILLNRAGHYAELHDLSEEWTIRGQLSETIAGELLATDSADSVVDTEGGGARTVLDGGTIYLEGEVPDQETADDLVASLQDVDSATPVVNNLTVVPGSPLPSGRVVIADAIFFDVASDEVNDIDEDTLAAITALAASREDWILTVVGHTDSGGSDVSNLELSLRRASALRDLLAAQGIPDENLRVRGAGETAPIGDNSTAAGRAENRRIEFEFNPKG